MLIVMSISTVISALIAVLPHVIIDPTPFVWSAPYRDHSQKLGWRAGSTWVQCRLFVYEWQSANRYHGDIGEASTPQFSATGAIPGLSISQLEQFGASPALATEALHRPLPSWARHALEYVRLTTDYEEREHFVLIFSGWPLHNMWHAHILSTNGDASVKWLPVSNPVAPHVTYSGFANRGVPYGINGTPFVGNILFYTALRYICYAIFATTRAIHITLGNKCVICKYPLCDGGQCPECGSYYDNIIIRHLFEKILY